MRKVLFAILALLGLAVCVRADELTFPLGELIVPVGSTVTSVITVPPGGRATESYIANFTFADGTGFAQGDFNDGDDGEIFFTTPVTNLTINWVATGFSLSFTDSDFNGFECSFFIGQVCDQSGTFTFAGTGITSLRWENFGGFSGIDSMSYTPTTDTPEPGVFPLLLVALLFLLVFREYRLRKLA